VGFPVHPADTVKVGVVLILMYGLSYNELGQAQDKISFPSGRNRGFWQTGLCCQNNSQIRETGRFFLTSCVSFPPSHEVAREGRGGCAMPMLDQGRRDRSGHGVEQKCGAQLPARLHCTVFGQLH